MATEQKNNPDIPNSNTQDSGARLEFIKKQELLLERAKKGEALSELQNGGTEIQDNKNEEEIANEPKSAVGSNVVPFAREGESDSTSKNILNRFFDGEENFDDLDVNQSNAWAMTQGTIEKDEGQKNKAA